MTSTTTAESRLYRINATFDEWYAELMRFARERHDTIVLNQPKESWEADYRANLTPKGAWLRFWD